MLEKRSTDAEPPALRRHAPSERLRATFTGPDSLLLVRQAEWVDALHAARALTPWVATEADARLAEDIASCIAIRFQDADGILTGPAADWDLDDAEHVARGPLRPITEVAAMVVARNRRLVRSTTWTVFTAESNPDGLPIVDRAGIATADADRRVNAWKGYAPPRTCLGAATTLARLLPDAVFNPIPLDSARAEQLRTVLRRCTRGRPPSDWIDLMRNQLTGLLADVRSGWAGATTSRYAPANGGCEAAEALSYAYAIHTSSTPGRAAVDLRRRLAGTSAHTRHAGSSSALPAPAGHVGIGAHRQQTASSVQPLR